jgi:hypothetical protein
LSILIALSVVLHLGQATPVHASMGTAVLAATSHNSGPCDSGHHPIAVHCGMTTGCSLCAPLEASPAVFLGGKSPNLPTAEAVEATWATRPQLRPPQHFLQF